MKIVNLEDIKQLLRIDNLFVLMNEKYGNPANFERPEGFIALSKFILGQQVSLESAKAHFLKLNSYIKEFSPSNILKLNDEEMRACQISRQKAKYLRALSTAIVEGSLELDKLPELPDSQVREKLTDIKGIGNWTADIYLMFCLQRKDVFPIGDIAVVNTIKELTDAHTKEEILSLSEKWKPYRSLASYFCWHYYLKKRNREDL